MKHLEATILSLILLLSIGATIKVLSEMPSQNEIKNIIQTFQK